LIDTSAGGLLVLDGIIRPVASESAMTWFIIIFITEILAILFRPFGFNAPRNFNHLPSNLSILSISD
jgi:hypothetical protein